MKPNQFHNLRKGSKMENIQINHAKYAHALKSKAEAVLRFIIKDCWEALAAMPDSQKAGYYQDEINYCQMELARRQHSPASGPLDIAALTEIFCRNVANLKALGVPEKEAKAEVKKVMFKAIESMKG